MNFLEENQWILPITILAFVFVVAVIPMKPEDMELHESRPPKMIDFLIIILVLVIAGLWHEDKQEVSIEVNENEVRHEPS